MVSVGFGVNGNPMKAYFAGMVVWVAFGYVCMYVMLQAYIWKPDCSSFVLCLSCGCCGCVGLYDMIRRRFGVN